ncbi:MAG: GFA family protein [Gammaproteobacteria bacterium]|nr:GFA family protein [Gammaproteobacteria bacterium]
MHKGSCLCAKVHYSIEGELSDFGYCHCNSCRKASGSAHGANSGIARANFKLSDEEDLVREFESSPGKFRAFCSRCGSPLYAYLTKSRDLIRIRLGSLDSHFNKTTKAHTFVSDKACWESIADSVPQFAEWAPREVLIQTGSKQP